MKFVIIGLGNFGSSLGHQLVEDGHEVIGVDNKMTHVTLLQDQLTHTICLDATDEVAIQKLPLEDADCIIVSIGEDIGSSVTTTALVKKLTGARIVARAISNVHQTILEAMDVEEIIHPEAEYAAELAGRLTLKGVVRSVPLDNRYEIVETPLPKHFVGKRIDETELRPDWNLNVITVMRQRPHKNFLGKTVYRTEVIGVVGADLVLEEKDILVLFGSKADVERFNQELG